MSRPFYPVYLAKKVFAILLHLETCLYIKKKRRNFCVSWVVLQTVCVKAGSSANEIFESI